MSWHWTTLEVVLQPVKDSIPILDNVFYKQAAIRPYPQGVVLKSLKSGFEFRQRRQKLVRAGQFVVSRRYVPGSIVGIVPTLLDGSVMPYKYITFNLHADLHVDYLAAYLSTPMFKQMSLGWYDKSGRLQRDQLEATPIPLPPLEDQRQIAELWQVANTAQAHTLDMLKSIEEVKAGVASELLRFNPSWERKQLGGCADIGVDLKGEHMLSVESPDKITLGAMGSDRGSIGILPNLDLDPQFLYYYLESQKDNLRAVIRGNTSTLLSALQTFSLPLPTLYQQRKIAAVLHQHDEVLLLLRQEQIALRKFTQGIMQVIFSESTDWQEVMPILRNLRS